MDDIEKDMVFGFVYVIRYFDVTRRGNKRFYQIESAPFETYALADSAMHTRIVRLKYLHYDIFNYYIDRRIVIDSDIVENEIENPF